MTATSPHRAYLDDVASVTGRVSARQAMTQLQDRGLGEVCSTDLEMYRLVMLPAEFKRLCHRLDKAVIAHWEHTQPDPEPEPLPFGDDLQEAVDQERRRQWVHRPNGEPLPRSWSVEPECRLPGRLKLIEGREFTVTGMRGRFRFRYAVRTTDGAFWLEAFNRDGAFRSIRPERVKRVHAKAKLHPRRAVRR